MTELHKTYLERVGTGVAVAYSLPFGYISEAHVKLVVDTVEKTFTFPTTNQLLPDEAPPDGSKVIIQRVTPSEAPMVDFTIAGAITPSNIDLGHQQALNVAQEAKDVVVLVLDSTEAIAASELAASQSALDAGAFVQDAEDAVDAAEAVRDAALDARNAAATSASEAEGYKDTVLAFADPDGITDGIAENTAAIAAIPAPVEIINNLTTEDADKPLAAEQGKVLKDQQDDILKISWATSERPASPTLNRQGLNTTLGIHEYWDNTEWLPLISNVGMSAGIRMFFS